MTAIEKLQKMIEDGEVNEFDLPIGCLRNEARAKKALAKFAPKEEAEDKAAYKAVKSLIRRRESVLALISDATEGSVGDFIDALSGDSVEVPEQWREELESISSQLSDNLLKTAYPYAAFLRDDKICDIITNKIGYTPIL